MWTAVARLVAGDRAGGRRRRWRRSRPRYRRRAAADAGRDPRSGRRPSRPTAAACLTDRERSSAGRGVFARSARGVTAPNGEGRRRAGARRRPRHARDAAAAEDGRQLLAVRDDAVGLRQSRDAVRRAGPARSRPEVYAVVAYVLNLNGIIAEDAVMDARSLPKVRMPNRDGFVADPRPDVGQRAPSK